MIAKYPTIYYMMYNVLQNCNLFKLTTKQFRVQTLNEIFCLHTQVQCHYCIAIAYSNIFSEFSMIGESMS